MTSLESAVAGALAGMAPHLAQGGVVDEIGEVTDGMAGDGARHLAANEHQCVGRQRCRSADADEK